MNREKSIAWWQGAKLGLFIHWGLYSLLGSGEWVMYSRRIPVREYEKLAGLFNPVCFDAEEWVKFAKDSGLGYIVITAKHHDGFSMFKTRVSPYNIVDATPFGRDPLAELAESCRRHGIKLGFYYSHVREWHHPLAASYEDKGRPDLFGNYGNFWDYPNENRKDLQAYIDEFDVPQIKELLTQYGDVLTIWFDTPSQITPRQGAQLRQLVYDTQEGCLVNSRLCDDIDTDYLTMNDDGIPASGLDVPWDSPMTTHNGWGYVENAVYMDWVAMARKVIEVVSKGGNLLMNIGPDSLGRIPQGSKDAFAQLGQWLRTNGEAIYGTRAAGLPYIPHWGHVTKKGNALYLLVTDSAATTLPLSGLTSRVVGCTALDSGESLPFTQNGHHLQVDAGSMRGDIRVIKVLCDKKVTLRQGIYPDDDGSVTLAASLATLERNPYSHMYIKHGITERWTSPEDALHWDFDTDEPGDYEIQILWDTHNYWRPEDFGHQLSVTLAGQIFSCTTSPDTPSIQGTRAFVAGRTKLAAGRHRLTLQPEHIVLDNLVGLFISGVKLTKC